MKKKKQRKPYHMHPNSLANMTPKGGNHNPTGYCVRKKDREIIAMTQDKLNTFLTLLLTSTKEDITAIENDPKATMLELSLAAIANRIVNDGDARALETLFARMLGKPKESIDVQTNAGPQVVVTLPTNNRIINSEVLTLPVPEVPEIPAVPESIPEKPEE